MSEQSSETNTIEPYWANAEDYFKDLDNILDDEIEECLGCFDSIRCAPATLYIVTNDYTLEESAKLRRAVADYLNESGEYFIVDGHAGQWVTVHKLDESRHHPGHHEQLYFTHTRETGTSDSGFTIIEGLRYADK